MNDSAVVASLHKLLLVDIVGQSCCTQRFGEYAEDQGELVDDELGPAQMVLGIPHVRAFEFGPFKFGKVETPDDGRHGVVEIYSWPDGVRSFVKELVSGKRKNYLRSEYRKMEGNQMGDVGRGNQMEDVGKKQRHRPTNFRITNFRWLLVEPFARLPYSMSIGISPCRRSGQLNHGS